MKLDQIYDGQWISPRHRGYLLQCCRCNLTHRINFRVQKGKIQFQVFRLKQPRPRKLA